MKKLIEYIKWNYIEIVIKIAMFVIIVLGWINLDFLLNFSGTGGFIEGTAFSLFHSLFAIYCIDTSEFLHRVSFSFR